MSNYPDRKYYNVVIAYNEKSNQPSYATFKNVFNQSFLDDPSKYYMSIIRFQIPTSSIPILIPEIENFPNTDVNKTVYEIELTYNGYSSGITNVIYETSNLNSQPRPITALQPNPMINPSGYYFIYDYRSFLDMVNKTFSIAYNNLNLELIANGQPPLISNPPYFTYNPVTYLFSLHCPQEYLTSLATPINIFMNYQLFTFFDGIERIFNGINNLIQIKVINYYGTNFIAPYYIMSQQYPSLSLWNTFKAIQITSQLLPVYPEVVPIPAAVQNTYNTEGVVKDFVPFYENGPEFRTFINFRYSGSYELIDLKSNAPISTIDINVYWIDRYGNKYLLEIPYNQLLTIKFVFIKKSSFTG